MRGKNLPGFYFCVPTEEILHHFDTWRQLEIRGIPSPSKGKAYNLSPEQVFPLGDFPFRAHSYQQDQLWFDA